MYEAGRESSQYTHYNKIDYTTGHDSERESIADQTRVYSQTVQQANQTPGTGRVRKQAGRPTDTDGQVQARDPKPTGRRLSPKQVGFKTGKSSKL